jgi:hypothetical protein
MLLGERSDVTEDELHAASFSYFQLGRKANIWRADTFGVLLLTLSSLRLYMAYHAISAKVLIDFGNDRAAKGKSLVAQ